jgi:hypothetical protein
MVQGTFSVKHVQKKIRLYFFWQLREYYTAIHFMSEHVRKKRCVYLASNRDFCVQQ